MAKNTILEKNYNKANDNVKAAFDLYKSLSKTDKSFFNKLAFFEDDFDYEYCKNCLTTEDNAKEMLEKLVQICIDFIKDHNNDEIEEVQFGVDGLQASADGEWVPGTDAYISLLGWDKKEGRYIIKTYC